MDLQCPELYFIPTSSWKSPSSFSPIYLKTTELFHLWHLANLICPNLLSVKFFFCTHWPWSLKLSSSLSVATPPRASLARRAINRRAAVDERTIRHINVTTKGQSQTRISENPSSWTSAASALRHKWIRAVYLSIYHPSVLRECVCVCIFIHEWHLLCNFHSFDSSSWIYSFNNGC